MWRRALLAASLAASLAHSRLAVHRASAGRERAGERALEAARLETELETGTSAAAVQREVSDANAYVATVMATLRTAGYALERELELNATAAEPGLAKAQSPGVHRLLPGAQKRLKEQQDLLKNLFAHLKGSVMRTNKQEKENKDGSSKLVKSQEEKIKTDNEKLKNPNLSTRDRERLVNRTHADERVLVYFKRGRDLQHSMFHSNLKIAHGLMSRVKNVMEIYTETLTKGQIDAKARSLLKRSLESVPRALLETQRKLRRSRRAGRRLHSAARYERRASRREQAGRRFLKLRRHA